MNKRLKENQVKYISEVIKSLISMNVLENMFPVIEDKNNNNISLEVWETACKKENVEITKSELKSGKFIIELK